MNHETMALSFLFGFCGSPADLAVQSNVGGCSLRDRGATGADPLVVASFESDLIGQI